MMTIRELVGFLQLATCKVFIMESSISLGEQATYWNMGMELLCNAFSFGSSVLLALFQGYLRQNKVWFCRFVP